MLTIPMADGTVMQRQVLGFDDRTVQIDGVDRVVPAIQMDNFNLYDDPHDFYSSVTSIFYSYSTLREYLTTTIQGMENPEFIKCLGSSKVTTMEAANGTKSVVYDKLFAPAMVEMGLKYSNYTAKQEEVEGPTPTLYDRYHDSTRKTRGGITARYWTRSAMLANTTYRLIVNYDGLGYISGLHNKNYVLAQFNFIGKY